MKKVITPSGTFGPFAAASIGSDHYNADGCIMPFTVYGEGGSVADAEPGDFASASPTVDQFVAAMDANFDAKAAEKNYDSRITCALRAGYAGPFQAEGIAFAQWMDNSYAAAYLILAAVQAGERPAPTTTAALLAELPQFDWANV